MAGANASLTVDGVNLTSASNTVSNLIPGVTFQLLSTSSPGSEVQVVIANDNSGVESAVNQLVTDYNSLLSAVNTQEGNTSSGTPEPLSARPRSACCSRNCSRASLPRIPPALWIPSRRLPG